MPSGRGAADEVPSTQRAPRGLGARLEWPPGRCEVVEVVEAVVTVPGAEPFSAPGAGERARIGLVVTHGFTASPVDTRGLGQHLAAEGYRVEVPLLPGHGTHHRDLGRTRYADWIGALERTVTSLRSGGAEAVVLVGHSLGATLSLDLASRDPSAPIAGVVAINAQLLDRTGALARLTPVLQYLAPYVPRDLAGLPTDDIAKPGVSEQAYATVPAKAARSLLVELPRIRAQLAALTAPLLVAVSPQDHTVDPANSRELATLAGSVDVEELRCERSYHVPLIDYDAALLTEAVVAFVARVGDAGARPEHEHPRSRPTEG